MSNSHKAIPSQPSVAFIHADAYVAGSMIRFLASAGMLGKHYESIEAFFADNERSALTAVVVDPSLMNPSAYKQIRESRDGAPLPVIAVSKSEAPDDRKIAQESGASAFFREPLDGETLLDAIEWEQSKFDASPDKRFATGDTP